ncbi:MAG: glycine/sarcosine/betaine reductase selenoprotein B family protein [Gemmatimonadota bacterium]|nr:glycine/sarcosine/betaine reductase selenoprotein B family protein [Gemmatimonadota bacterium]
MTIRSVLDRAVARAIGPFPELQRWWARKAAEAEVEGETPWVPFEGRFAESRIAVFTTGGFRFAEQPAFDCDAGDPSWRAIPHDAELAELVVDHTHYDTRDAKEDPNILLPLDRLRELVDEGALGGLAPTHYSMMGYVPQTAALVEETAPEVVEAMRREEVDLVLLTPA